MNSKLDQFERDGFVVVGPVVEAATISRVRCALHDTPVEGAGSRRFLEAAWCRELAANLPRHPLLADLLPATHAAVQCTLFWKSAERNWLVGLHRDKSFPVKDRVHSPDWQGWSLKEGQLFARPPGWLVRELVAVRVHLDAADEETGALQVVPGSHRNADTTDPRIACEVGCGSALVMRPSLLHASSKLRRGERRVLHFVYGPRDLPHGAEWADAV